MSAHRSKMRAWGHLSRIGDISVVRDETVWWRARRVCGHLRPSVMHERRRVGRDGHYHHRKT